MNKDIVLTELQIDEIKKTADKERRKFGIIDAPIAGDLFMLLVYMAELNCFTILIQLNMCAFAMHL